jgi:hypothetical protein
MIMPRKLLALLSMILAVSGAQSAELEGRALPFTIYRAVGIPAFENGMIGLRLALASSRVISRAIGSQPALRSPMHRSQTGSPLLR